MSNRGYFGVGLVNPKNLFNIGGAIRACGCFKADFLAIQGRRYKYHSTDAQKVYRHLPVFHNVDNLHDIIPYDCIPIAVELIDEAQPLQKFKHPERAFYIFGAEDATLDSAVLSWCKYTVCVPAGSLNLAACVNVVLYDRIAKLETQR